MKIVVAPNAFKGSMTARKAAEAMKEGIIKAILNAEADIDQVLGVPRVQAFQSSQPCWLTTI